MPLNNLWYENRQTTGKERMAELLNDYLYGGNNYAGTEEFMNANDWSPTGNLPMLYDAGAELGRGNYGSGIGLAALASIPLPPAVKKIAGKVAGKAKNAVKDLAGYGVDAQAPITSAIARKGRGLAKLTPEQIASARATLDEPIPTTSLGRQDSNAKQIPGAPKGIYTPEQEAALRAEYIRLAELGAEGRDWYKDSGGTILDMAGRNVNDAYNFSGAAAVTSANTGVNANLGHAFRGYNQALVGDKINTGQFPKAMGKAIQKSFDAPLLKKSSALGRKREPYMRNLLIGMGKPIPGEVKPVNDVWNARAWGFQGTPTLNKKTNIIEERPYERSPTPAQHEWMDNQAKIVIKELNANNAGGHKNWDELTSQAAVWIAKIAEKENIPVHKAATRLYGSYVDKNMAQLTWEADAGRTLKSHLPGQQDAAWYLRKEYADRVKSAVKDPVSGRDAFVRGFGGMGGEITEGPGVFNNKVSPGFSSRLGVGKGTGGETFDPSSEKLADAIEGSRGLLLGQDAIAYNFPGGEEALKRATQANIDLPRGARIGANNPNGMLSVAQKMSAAMGAEADKVIPTVTKTGLRFLYRGDNPEKFNKVVKGMAKDMGGTSTHHKGLASQYIKNDWRKQKAGQTYIEMIGKSPELIARFNATIPTISKRLMAVDTQWAKDRGIDISQSELMKVREVLSKPGNAWDNYHAALKAGTIGSAAAVLIMQMMGGEAENPGPA
jgi:hypothetical protein